MSDPELEKSISALEETGQFRVLRRAQLGPTERPLSSAEDSRIAIIVDTETTGLDVLRDEVVEIGMIAFPYDRRGNVGSVINTFGAMQQPSQAISAEISALTGISNEMLHGRTIDRTSLETFVKPASLIVAHNAAFDRPMCERLSSSFAEKPWACSATEIDWRRFGFEGTKLTYILNQFGQFHSGHRAIDDCTALFNILKAPLVGTDGSVFAEILSCARKTRYRISVVSPYELRNALKARGYRWYPGGSGRPRSWWIEASEERQTEELNFLFRESRLPRDRILVERLTALNRYKSIESPSLRRDTW
jgi:DNA polymerase-3 subunit epsilon